MILCKHACVLLGSSHFHFLKQCLFKQMRELQSCLRNSSRSQPPSLSILLSCCAPTLRGVPSWLATADLPRDRAWWDRRQRCSSAKKTGRKESCKMSKYVGEGYGGKKKAIKKFEWEVERWKLSYRKGLWKKRDLTEFKQAEREKKAEVLTASYHYTNTHSLTTHW